MHLLGVCPIQPSLRLSILVWTTAENFPAVVQLTGDIDRLLHDTQQYSMRPANTLSATLSVSIVEHRLFNICLSRDLF